MGFLTIVAISNDFWHKIAEDPDKTIGAISEGMNYGTGSTSPINEVYAAQETNENVRRHNYRMEYLDPQGLEVFRTRHYDEPQVIVNTYGTQPINAAELPYAIQKGWLDLNKYNEGHADRIASELENLAKDIRLRMREQQRAKIE